jgi:predicted nucleotidyltransferase
MPRGAHSLPEIEIEAHHWAMVQQVLQTHLSAYEVWAFGSRAKKHAKPFSDLDIAVISCEPIGLELMATLHEAFSESDLPWKVDVVDWASTTPEFQAIIKRDHVVLQRPRNTP